MKKRPKVWITVCVATGLLAVGFVTWRFASPVQVVSPGNNIRFDDFDFTAISAKEVAEGKYEVVARVTNSAKRVDFQFDPSVVQILGPDSSRLVIEAMPNSSVLHVGEIAEGTFQALGPRGLKTLLVNFEFGGSIGAVLDTILYGRRQVRLKVAP